MESILLNYKYKLYTNTYILCYSSLLLLIPTIYSYYLCKYNYCLFLLSLIMISIIHWIKPQNGIRRYIDIFVSKISFIYSVIIFYIYADIQYYILSLPILYYIITNYNKSCYYFTVNNSKWIYHHIFFHASLSCGQMLIIFCTK
jgi:hypothetical protein